MRNMVHDFLGGFVSFQDVRVLVEADDGPQRAAALFFAQDADVCDVDLPRAVR